MEGRMDECMDKWIYIYRGIDGWTDKLIDG
jgi:hypothetical protein